MAEASLAVASAVILPEIEKQDSTSPGNFKRRQSSFSEDRPKRPRISEEGFNDRQDSAASPRTERPLDRASERRKSGQVEERKRGQRLFGALLGTLSQSSSSTASNRRSEIEKKQQAKLKLQVEEENEKKKQKKEALTATRLEEQVKYDKQSMHIRHSSILARAHFLHTRGEPKIYYKPWELLPSQEESIKSQIAGVEATIEKENEQWNADHPPAVRKEMVDGKSDPPEPQGATETNGHKETVGSPADKEKPPSPRPDEDTDIHGTTPPDHQRKTTEPPEGSKDHETNEDEIVEGEEDTVIY